MFSNIKYEAYILSYMTCIRSFIHNIFSNFSLFSNRGWSLSCLHSGFPCYRLPISSRLMVYICILMSTHTWHAFSKRVLTQPPRENFFYQVCIQKLSTKEKKNTVYEDKILQPVLHSNSSKENILFDYETTLFQTTLFQEVYDNKVEVPPVSWQQRWCPRWYQWQQCWSHRRYLTAMMESSLIPTTTMLKSLRVSRQQCYSPRWYQRQQFWSPCWYHNSNDEVLVHINNSNVEVPAGIMTATIKSSLISMTSMMKSSQISRLQCWIPHWYQRQ